MRLHRTLQVCCLLLIADAVVAAPCASIKARPDAWIRARTDALVNSAHAAFDDEKNLPAYNRTVTAIAQAIEQCKLQQNTTIAERFPEFFQYISALSLLQRSDHELGFKVTDKQYFQETRQFVQVPDFLLDQKFLRAVSRFETLPQAKAMLRAMNKDRSSSQQLTFLSYESQHLGTPDNDDSFLRLLILVPADTTNGIPEKWVQFGITDPGVKTRTRNVSVVATTPNTAGGSNVYFKDFFRTYYKDGSIGINGRWEMGYGDDNCVQCHKSGVLPIFPEPGSLSAEDESALADVNSRFRSYGKPQFGNYRDDKLFGPGLATGSDGERVKRFGFAPDDRVARAMDCASCHNSERLGRFNWPMDQVLISSFIKGGKMPYGVKLNASERNELYDRLIEEYFATNKDNPGVLKSWLLGQGRTKF